MTDPVTIAYIAAGALAGGFLNGLAGFGTALMALGFWLQVVPPVQAVAMSLVMSVLVGIQGLWVVRFSIGAQRFRLMRLLIPAAVGIPLGVLALNVAEPRTLKLVIAFFALLYGGFFLARRTLPAFAHPARAADVAIGFIGGFLGGFSGVSGAVPAMWFALRPWTKSETRAVLQPFNVVVLIGTGVILAWNGAYGDATLRALVIAIPAGFVGAQAGIHVFRRISDIGFRWLLIGLLFTTGAAGLVKELL